MVSTHYLYIVIFSLKRIQNHSDPPQPATGSHFNFELKLPKNYYFPTIIWQLGQKWLIQWHAIVAAKSAAKFGTSFGSCQICQVIQKTNYLLPSLSVGPYLEKPPKNIWSFFFFLNKIHQNFFFKTKFTNLLLKGVTKKTKKKKHQIHQFVPFLDANFTNLQLLNKFHKFI